MAIFYTGLRMFVVLIRKLLLLVLLHTFVGANEQGLDKVVLQLQWKHQFEFAGFYAAIEKGFYKDVGLEVELVPLKEDTDIVAEVLNGRADYGLSYSSIISEYLNDKPIVFVANFFKQSPLVLATQKDISSLSQLKYAKIEGLSNNIDSIPLYSMLKKFGIEDGDFESLPPSFGIEAFVNKEVDAIAIFVTNETYLLDQAGVEYNVYDPVSYGVTYYDTNLFTSKKEALRHPDRVRAFKKASVEGWKYALEHKEEIVDIILEKYNTQKKSKEALLFEAKQIEQIMLPKLHDIGSIDLERVRILAEEFIQSGYAKSAKKNELQKFIFDTKEQKRKFTSAEKQYIQEKESLKLCVDPEWMPIEALDGNTLKGLSADFWKMMEQKTGLKSEVFRTQSWNGSIEAMKQHKCDVLSFSSPTIQREDYLNFTDPFLELQLVVATTLEKQTIIDMHDLDAKAIAVVESYALADIIRKNYPNIDLVEVRDIHEGLNLVKTNKVYGYADTALAIDYIYKNDADNDLKISGYFNEKLHLALGVRKKDLKLYSILQKVVGNISAKEKKELFSKYTPSKHQKSFDFTLFLQLSVLVVLVLGFFAYRNHVMKKLNKELERKVQEEIENSKEKDKMIYQQRKLVSMGNMIENIAHQWRQPLSQVNSCVLVIDDVLDAEGISNEIIQEKLEEIEGLTKYMSTTIEDFKNFFDQNKKSEEFFIEDAVDQALLVLSTNFEKNSILIERGLATQHACIGYKNELQQVVLVLLNNARDVLIERDIPRKKIRISVDQIDDKVVLGVSDNGGGVDVEIVEKIFEPYFTTKFKSKGVGLGLYMAKMIIEDSMKGKLYLENSHLGATFIIELRAK